MTQQLDGGRRASYLEVSKIPAGTKKQDCIRAAVLWQINSYSRKVHLSISAADNNKRSKKYEKLHAISQSLLCFVCLLHCDGSNGSIWPQPLAIPTSEPIFIATYGLSMAAAKSRCQALECIFTAAPSGALASLLYCLLNVYTNSFAGPWRYLWDMVRVRLFMRSSFHSS